MTEFNRRHFLTGVTAGMSLLRAADADPWARTASILARIRPPAFPDREFDITRSGAVADGKTDCTEAFRRAIAECNHAGGGRVVVPAGTYLTGAIHLLSNVNLHLAEGAVVRFSQDEKHYLPLVYTRFEGLECMNYSPLLYAFKQDNIAITGSGTLDGASDASHWWPWKGKAEYGWSKGAPNQSKAREALVSMGERGVPVEKRVFGPGGYLRPMFIQPYACRNVLIDGVHIRNSPMYEIHPVLCTNVMVRGVDISSHGPNNDGCDPESSTDVWIKDCTFDTGDDCIAIKSGRNADGRRVNVPSQNLVIQGCRMKDGHGGVTAGSEASGGIRNVFAEDCRMDSPHLDRILRLKTNAVRGGFIENIYMRNVSAGQVSGPAIDIDLYYEEGPNGKYPPAIRNIDVRNITCVKCKQALSLRGYKSDPIQNVHLEFCTFEHTEQPNVVENVKDLVMHTVMINGKTAT